MSLSFLLQVIAFVLLMLGAFGVPTNRISLPWLGMALWLLSLITNGFIR